MGSSQQQGRTQCGPLLVLRLIAYGKEYPLSCIGIFNDVLTGPFLAKFSHTHFCDIEGLHSLNEMQDSIGLQLVDAKKRAHQTPIGDNCEGGQWNDYDMEEAAAN